MKRTLTILALLLVSYFSFGQLENANWCFKDYARVNFNPLATATSVNGGPVNTVGAPASVSDANGNLLFYTNGNIIWDKFSNPMPNGSNIYSSQISSTDQTTLIVPKPNHSNIYYVFTVNLNVVANGIRGFYYSVVDMCLNNGKGDVVPNQKNIVLKNYDGIPLQYDGNNNVTESRLTSTPNNDKTKIWVSFFTRFATGTTNDRFAYNYLISENGINSVMDGTSPNATTKYTITAAEFPNYPPNWFAFGCIKFSPDGNYLCDANSCAVNVYTFNNTTGTLAFLATKYTFVQDVANAGYGVEFSPNSSLIYFSTYENILYQTSKGNGNEDDTSKVMRVRQANVLTRGSVVIGEYALPATDSMKPPPTAHDLGNLQLAIDNKIYVCSDHAGTPAYTYLGVVQSPNTPGPNSLFITNGLQLAAGTTHERGLPQWVHKTIFVPGNPCGAPPLSGRWTWMKEDNLQNQPGDYGIKGVASSTNRPPARYDAITWTDNNGIFWMFGGANAPNMMYNDLWKYDKTSGNWTWVNGSNGLNQAGVYGTQGVPSSLNQPGGREAPITWVEASGNFLWLYGGWAPSQPFSFQNKLNDLWKYNISTNEWTWVNGSNTINQYAVYGTQGIPSASNTTGAKGGAVSWKDVDGNLWMFGGDGLSSAYAGLQNDLWKYNISTNLWTWMKGEDNTNDPATYRGVYGTQGIKSSANRPGSRAGAVTWTDNSNNLWLFGGFGQALTTTGNLNDLWKFNKSSGNWTWISGDNVADQLGIYGTPGQASVNNKPGSRTTSVAWTTADGNFWLFGGFGSNAIGGAVLNDLWQFNTGTQQWMWVNGSNTATIQPTYGVLGISSPTTNPGGRSRACSWLDGTDLWLFSGAGNYNDVWKYSINCNSPNCRNALQFQAQNMIIKENETAIPKLASINAIEIYNTSGQLVKKINDEKRAIQILQSPTGNGTLKGLYFIRIYYNNKTSKTIKKLFN